MFGVSGDWKSASDREKEMSVISTPVSNAQKRRISEYSASLSRSSTKLTPSKTRTDINERMDELMHQATKFRETVRRSPHRDGLRSLAVSPARAAAAAAAAGGPAMPRTGLFPLADSRRIDFEDDSVSRPSQAYPSTPLKSTPVGHSSPVSFVSPQQWSPKSPIGQPARRSPLRSPLAVCHDYKLNRNPKAREDLDDIHNSLLALVSESSSSKDKLYKLCKSIDAKIGNLPPVLMLSHYPPPAESKTIVSFVDEEEDDKLGLDGEVLEDTASTVRPERVGARPKPKSVPLCMLDSYCRRRKLLSAGRLRVKKLHVKKSKKTKKEKKVAKEKKVSLWETTDKKDKAALSEERQYYQEQFSRLENEGFKLPFKMPESPEDVKVCVCLLYELYDKASKSA